MVSESGDDVMSACADFAQHAWKKEVCVNCQRPKTEHPKVPENPPESSKSSQQAPGTDSPKPAKRNSLMTKSWTPMSTDDKAENEDDKWNSMCLPDPDQPDKRLGDHDQRFQRPEHCYEDIDGEEMKQKGQNKQDNSKRHSIASIKTDKHTSNMDSRSSTSDKTRESKSGSRENMSTLNVDDRTNSFVRNGVRDSQSRSRSSSRDKSPAPALKPKPVDIKPSQIKVDNNTNKVDNTNNTKSKPDKVSIVTNKDSQSSPRSKKKLKSGGRSISFVENNEVIGTDGGLDNLIPSDSEEYSDSSEPARREVLQFTEDEKDWALQSLKNTIWNTEHVNADSDKDKSGAQSKEFEDIGDSDKIANVSESDQNKDDKQNFGTFPLRNKSEKAAMDSMFAVNRLSTLSETQENAYNFAKLGDDVEDKYESMLKYLGVDKNDFMSSPKHKVTDKTDIDNLEPSYEDPWEDKLVFDTQSDMNLLDEIKGEIDLESSGAGLALVDLLNDMLSKYSTGTPSETDSVKNLDTLEDDNKDKKDVKIEKSADLEAKVATLAANIRKQRAKGRAPRPPSCPPEPPAEVSKSPAKQLELRAQQSKEPTFKMVPLGKAIGPNPLSQSAPDPATLPLTADNKDSNSNNSSPSNTLNGADNVENLKKKEQKKSGGIGGFFSRFLRRGRDSENDLTSASTETLNSNLGSNSDLPASSATQGDLATNFVLKKVDKPENPKPEKRSSKASPQMKAKVLPTRPISPKPPPEKPAQTKETINEPEKDPKSSQRSSSSNGSSNVSVEKPTDEKEKQGVTEETAKKPPSGQQPPSKPKEDKTKPQQLSPSKPGENKDQLAVSPKSKEAPPLPANPPRELTESQTLPRPRARGNSDGNPPRSRPRTRDFSDGKPRDTPNVPPPKPPVAAKPRPPPVTGAKQGETIDPAIKGGMPVQKDPLSSTKSLDEAGKKPDPSMLRKRAKSPKRMAAPGAPVARSSAPNLTNSTASLTSNVSESGNQNVNATNSMSNSKPEQKGFAIAKELELKLNNKDQPVTNASEVRKMSAPPPPPSPNTKTENAEKSKSLPKDTGKSIAKDKDLQKTSSKEVQRTGSGSKDDLKTSPPEKEEKPKTIQQEVINDQSQNQNADVPIQVEKIELPKPVGNSRKSFLGKLNRKNKPPPPPSVKRTKSITGSETSSTDLHVKKIDVKDISGPVLITDMSSNKVMNRRNTITLGEDNAFHSGGSTSSGSTSAGEKSDVSPRGSIENLYEFITSEAPTPPTGEKKNFYDPVVEKNIALRPPSISGIEGYLEPVRSNQGPALGEAPKPAMTESSNSMGSMTTSIVSMATSMATSITAMTQSVDQLATSASTTNNDPSLDSSDISDERRELLASQPIYEEINGYGRLGGSSLDKEDDQSESGEQIYGVNVGHDGADGQTDIQTGGQTPQLPTLKSKDSFSSDSDMSSTGNSLSRPRPIPRKRPQHVGSGFEQYVAMNKPSVAVFLNEEQLREMLNRLTAMNLETLRELYSQHEKCFTKENLSIGAVGPLKWHDFNIYGKPLHMSEKCLVYNAKLKASMSPCQVMLLHSRPEITTANHPSLLKPTCIFNDAVPFSYLTEDFIRTSQILETCVSQSNLVKCYVVVGLFDITESVNQHLGNLQTACENQRDFLRKILFFVLQLLSAISHCLEQGHPLAEADFHDLYLISNPYCLGETVSFLPQVRAPEDQQIETVCLFLERFLENMCKQCEADSVLDDTAFFTYTGIQKCMEILQSGVAECLPIVRSYTEFLLWGPEETDPKLTDNRQSNLEPQLAMWLEKERSELIHDFAMRVQRGSRCNIKDFYKMKFLLKASASSLAECVRCHMSMSS